MPYEANKKWRLKHPKSRYNAKKRNYAKGRNHNGNSRRRWRRWEVEIILADSRPIDRVLAEKLGRSVQAIQTARIKFKSNELKISHLPK